MAAESGELSVFEFFTAIRFLSKRFMLPIYITMFVTSKPNCGGSLLVRTSFFMNFQSFSNQMSEASVNSFF